MAATAPIISQPTAQCSSNSSLNINEYIDSGSQQQQQLRRNARYLERPVLRKMYSDLFNDVTRLDYAVRDTDKDCNKLKLKYGDAAAVNVNIFHPDFLDINTVLSRSKFPVMHHGVAAPCPTPSPK